MRLYLPDLFRSLLRITTLVAVVLVVFIGGVWLLIAQPLYFVDVSPPGISIAPERLEFHVRTLSESFFPRSSENRTNLERTASYIHAEFTRARGRVADQVFRLDNGLDYRNVVATFGPASGERIVVGAHYDTHGELPGADDNASGVAGLIELAHLLGDVVLPAPVELVAYTLEELPYFATPDMGSAVHARALREAGVPVRLMITLETIGFYDETPGSQRYPAPYLKLFYPNRGNFIAVVGRIDQRATVGAVKRAMMSATSLPVFSISAFPWTPGIDYSDHRSYWAVGYPAVMITDTAFLRSAAYHTERDIADRLDYNRMAEVVKAVYATVLASAAN